LAGRWKLLYRDCLRGFVIASYQHYDRVVSERLRTDLAIRPIHCRTKQGCSTKTAHEQATSDLHVPCSLTYPYRPHLSTGTTSSLHSPNPSRRYSLPWHSPGKMPKQSVPQSRLRSSTEAHSPSPNFPSRCRKKSSNTCLSQPMTK
jgi:hypothetical protein